VAFSSCKLPVDNALTATLKLLDLRNNSIARLPYEVMDFESPELSILLDGNPCARELDWSDLEVNRLPLRLQGGYESMGWEVEVRTVKLGGNRLDESVFEKLLDANFTNIEELDVSRNALGGLPKEDVRGLQKLRKLDVSWNNGISVG
jgi:Leucine-rich repeat (LRR) protein